MDVKEVLKFVDDLVLPSTGKHLDDLQQAILRGVWQGQKYSKIAEESHCTEGHVKDVASDLWKMLSDVLRENLNKSNFRATMERCRFSNVSNFGKDFVQVGKLNFCTDNFQASKVQSASRHQQTNHDNTIKVRQDLGDAPDISSFYGRTEELTNLEQWIVQERCRLVALLGLSGIGKTALAVKLIEKIQDKFEYIIWRSIQCKPPLEVIQTNLIQFLSNQQEIEVPVSTDDKLSQLIEYLRKYRCLIIFDDAHQVFSSGQVSGCYKPGYEDYSLLFKRLGELSHNSCLMLISWEKPREVAMLEGDNKPVRSLQLDGLDKASAGEILKEKGLAESDKWKTLIHYYGGNPLWLQVVATMIRDVLSGKISDLFKYEILFLTEDLQEILHQHFQRLSELEKQVMFALANQAEAVSISKLLENPQLLPSDLFNAIQSLGRRSLIEKKEQDSETLFTLQPVVREYVKRQDMISNT